MQDNNPTADSSHSLGDTAPQISEYSDINTSQPMSLAEETSLEKRAEEDENENEQLSSKSLTDMPVEVLMEISLQLPCRAFARFLQTNRYIHDTINTHYIWHRRFTIRFGQTILKSKLNLLLPKGSSAGPNTGTSSSRASTEPPSPGSLPESNTNSGISGNISSHTLNRDTPSSQGGLGLPGQYHNHEDPTSSTSSPPLPSVASSPTPSGASTPLADGESGEDGGGNRSSEDGGNGNGDEDEDAKKRAKGKGRKIDLRKTTQASKELLIELYKQYSRMTLPAEEMAICHMDGRYWEMIENNISKFGKLAQLHSVWWMDIIVVFYGVPPGRYKVQWRVKATSDAPIINSEFKAIPFDKHDDNPGDRPDAILFKPRNALEFIEQTDLRVTKANIKPFRSLFQKDFTILELPGELLIEDDYQNVFLQIRNHEG
ncbi:hypothetical protein EDD21DRAFT_175245 [Dissophora ornata]|nr:hypothetical protein EDD21DRAFT_175245 [Dissophora ornata]